MYHRILEIMLPSLEKALIQYDAALKGDDATPLKDIAHYVRGMSSNVGADILTKAAADLEHALIDGHASDQQMTAFRLSIEETLQVLRKIQLDKS